MSRCVRNLIVAAAGMLAFAPARTAISGDLGDALGYLEDNAGEGFTKGLEDHVARDDDAALAMINARDVSPNKPLEAYGCDESTIDKKWVLRTNGNLRWNDRACKEARFNRAALPGYRTLGQVKLSKHKVAPWIDAAAERFGVSAKLIDTIIRFSSGYRPGLVKDDGSIGIMQIRPEYQGAKANGNLLDPRANILAGAAILRDLIDRYGSLELGLVAFHAGEAAVKQAPDWETAIDRETLWFVREIRRIVRAEEAPFPVETGVDSMNYVMHWLDWPSER